MTDIPKDIAAQLERTDWTPAEALQFYADQKNFDIVKGRVRIIDNGAIASNALKHLSTERLELKGDAELTELRSKVTSLVDAIKLFLKNNDPEGFGCACTPLYKCGPCTEREQQKPLRQAIK